jgi:hypothetical protein
MIDKTPITAEKWEWFGMAGHFICGRWCRFHLTTRVGKFLVSTVGLYVHPRRSNGREDTEAEWLAQNPRGEQIGADRFYETMVFLAGERCREKNCGCGQPRIAGGQSLDFLPADDAGEANKNHRKLCKKWAAQQDWKRPKDA